MCYYEKIFLACHYSCPQCINFTGHPHCYPFYSRNKFLFIQFNFIHQKQSRR